MTYFLNINGVSVGPLSIEDLAAHNIQSETLVWRNGFQEWRKAQNVQELQSVLSALPPPLPDSNHRYIKPDSIGSAKTTIDYSEVEDVAGVDYKQGMMYAGLLVAHNVLLPNWTLTTLGMITVTLLAGWSWYYFKAYFDARSDTDTGQWILLIMIATIAFGVVYIFGRWTDWPVLIAGGIWEFIYYLFSGEVNTYFNDQMSFGLKFIFYVTLGAAAANVIAGFKIIMVNKRYPFPLKRIALSSMIFLPILFMNYFSEGILNISEPSTISRLILSLPYIFLLHHFYRAETEDISSAQSMSKE